MTSEFILDNLWLLGLTAIWTLPWKGVALWKAAKRDDQRWFIALLLINTLAILDIIYIYVISQSPQIGRKKDGDGQSPV